MNGKDLKGQRQKAGFTLIEVLIVVVIIGVLAALVIPRMMGQTEKAKMAEAFHVLGALHRAEQAYMDLTGSTLYLGANTQTGSVVNFARLGVQTPGTTSFAYQCTWDGVNNACYAYRQPIIGNGWDAGNSQIGLNDDGTWWCGGVLYRAGATSADSCVLR